jgi:threonine dehydratase
MGPTLEGTPPWVSPFPRRTECATVSVVSDRPVRPPTAHQLTAAAEAVGAALAPTPVVAAPELGERVWLKLETLQPTGSFKIRGAVAAMAAAPVGRVVTASAGNHGLALARAAMLLGREATVVVAADASRAKVDRLRSLPVRLVQRGRGYDEAERAALDLASSGAAFVSPYNDPYVIAGQRTLGLELGRRFEGGLTVVAPVGGGGLLAGLALWAAERGNVRLVGVEAAASTAFSASLAAGRVVDVPIGETIADGLAGGLEAGSVTVDIVRDSGAVEMVTVREGELLAAVAHLHREHGLVVEGAGAAAVAAVRSGRAGAPNRPVVALVTGRNVTDEVLLRALGA